MSTAQHLSPVPPLNEARIASVPSAVQGDDGPGWYANLINLLPERETVFEAGRTFGHYARVGGQSLGVIQYAPDGFNRIAGSTIGFLFAVNLTLKAEQKRAAADLESQRADAIADGKSKRKALRLAEAANRRANTAEFWAKVNLHLRLWPTCLAAVVGGGHQLWSYLHHYGLVWGYLNASLFAQIVLPMVSVLIGAVVFGALEYRRLDDVEPIVTPRQTGHFDITQIREAMAKLGNKKLADDIEDVHIPLGGYDPERECFRFQIETPRTVPARDVVKNRNAWATALGIQEFRIKLEEAPTMSANTFFLTVFDKDPSERKQGGYPYSGVTIVDASGPVIIGDGVMGEPTTVTNPDGDTGVFGMKGSGKTERIKNLLVPLVLDPNQEIKIIDAKDTSDYLEFKPACTDYLTGSSFESIRMATAALEWVRDVYMLDIAENMRREGVRKITGETAKLPGLNFLTIVIEECQALFEHPDFGARNEAAVGWIQKMGRAYGIKFIFGTQVPTKKSLPNDINGQISTVICHRMKLQTQVAQAIGSSAYENGGAAHEIRESDKGMAVVKGGGSGELLTSTAYLLTSEILEPIIEQGLAHRGGKVTKRLDALPEESDTPEGTGNILDDIMSLCPDLSKKDVGGLHYQMVVDQLKAKYPRRYGESYSLKMLQATMFTHGVPAKQVSVPTQPQPNLTGYRWNDVDAARKGLRP